MIEKQLPDEVLTHVPQMSLRDWFAGQALNGFCSMANSMGDWSWVKEAAIERAYELADAMLAERVK